MPERNAELERAVIADPNDEAAMLVLADWLQLRGDPHGELIALQHAQKTERDPARFMARKRAAEKHFQQHEAALLGELHAYRHLMKLEWHLGFIRVARLAWPGAASTDDPNMATLVGRLVELPVALALQELTLGALGRPDPDGGRYEPVLEELARRGKPACLRTLFLGDYWPGTSVPWEHDSLGDLSLLSPAFSRLRKLVIHGGEARYGELVLPALRQFEHRAPIGEATIEWLLATEHPLEQVSLNISTNGSETIVRLLEQARWPRLEQLRLHASIGTGAVIDHLARSPLLQALKLIDLADGDLDDLGAARLVELWPKFKHVKTFHLGAQEITNPNTAKRLRTSASRSSRRTPTAGEPARRIGVAG